MMNSLRYFLNEALSRVISHKHAALLLTFSFVFAGAVFYPQLRAGLWIADDHQILDFVSQVGRSFNGYWTIITNPDDFPLASNARFRPVYWPLRITEIFLWYDNGFGWHFARLLMISAFLGLISLSLNKIANAPFALLSIFVIVQLDSVAGVWTRLGNAEAYAAVGVAAIVWGSVSLIRSATEQLRASITSLTLLNLGVLLAAGSKENFFFFSLFLLIPPYFVVWQKLRHPLILLSWAAAAIISMMMAKHLMKTFASTNNTEHSVFVTIFNHAIGGINTLLPFLWFPILLFLVAVYVSSFLKHTRFTKPLKADNILFVAVCGFLVVCCISQPTFHNGDWPAKDIYSRYNFVGWFSAFLIGALSAAVIYRSVAMDHAEGVSQSTSSTYKAAGLGMLCVAYLIYQHPSIYNQAVSTFNRTDRTARGLSAITEKSVQKGFDFLTIEVQSSRDYEASISTIIHLRHRGLEVPIYVKVKPASDPYNQNALMDRLRKFSKDGERGFSPINELDPSSNNCLSIFFYKIEIDDTRCEKFTFSY